MITQTREQVERIDMSDVPNIVYDSGQTRARIWVIKHSLKDLEGYTIGATTLAVTIGDRLGWSMWKYGAPAALMALVVLRKIAAFGDRIRRVALAWTLRQADHRPADVGR